MHNLIINPNYKRKDGEGDLDYAMRLIAIKKELKPGDLDWCDIVDLLGLDYNPDSLRKAQDSQYGGLAVYKEMQKRIANSGQSELANSLNSNLQELQKMKYSIADERTALNKLLREQSRLDSIKEIAKECVGAMPPLEYNKFSGEHCKYDDDRSLVITLSDFHYGLEINEFNNEYNANIFHRRLELLLARAIDCMVNDEIRNVIVIGLGDFIAGLIHNVIRIESRENVIQQVISVSEALIDFLNQLALYAQVAYFDCVGNHSRLFEDKDNCLSKESFDILIHYILKQRFEDDENVLIHDYTINERIGEFEVYGKRYAFVHGDGFNLSTLAKDLASMTKNFYEGIFIGHIHHLFIEEQNGMLVISNGTFAGNDEYANKINKSSVPSQNMFIISQNGIEDIKTIKLDEI